MNARLIFEVLWRRRGLRRHEAWSRAKLARWQQARLAKLRQHALTSSPFLRRFHAGLESRPLHELPVLTKSLLMANFDELSTDRDVKLADVKAHVAAMQGDERYLGRYWVAATSGSTGQPGIFLADRDEWTTIIASYARANQWSGLETGLFHRVRTAVVSSRTPWHQSARVGRSLDSPWLPTLRLDATSPLPEITAALDRFSPEMLVCYASMGGVLADEQAAGRLHIAPRAVMCASEVLTEALRRRLQHSFGSEPFNVYAATETAGIASECAHHRLHLYEDLVITEVVDEHDRPVPDGVAGARVLVSVLFSRTQPVIRYAMSDSVTTTAGTCPCGRPFALIAAIEGRAEDVLVLPASAGGTVNVHPNVFHRALELVSVAAWQLREESDRLRLLLQSPGPSVVPAEVALAIDRELRAVGAAAPRVEVEIVDAIPRTRLGKAPLVVARAR